jgi:predicted lipoprotein with Yx(FWY)xxD motif
MSTVRERRVTGVAVAAGLAVLAAAAASCGASPGTANVPAAPPGARVTIDARSLSGVGQVLVSSGGYALYLFEPDGQRQVTCTGLCAATWPPVKISAAASLVAGPGVRSALLSSDPDPAGGRVVTYNGWPLYTYTGDVEPGQVTGQGIDLNGGDWYVIRPSGQPLTSGPG